MNTVLPRLLAESVESAARTMPVVVITGARRRARQEHVGETIERLAPKIIAVLWWRVI